MRCVGLLLLVAAAACRIYGCFNDLWLDEIWSLDLVGKISSPWQVFSNIHQENNHYLNSLWMFFAGARGNWPGYRFPSVAAGIGSVVLAGMIGRRRNSRAALFAMVLVAFSYVQILYSSEARGYAEVVFFSFLSFYALELYLESGGWRYAFLFSIGSILGLAAHLVYINFLGAAILWSGWRLAQSGKGWKGVIKSILACHAAPIAFLAAVYFVDLRHVVQGGGTETGFPAAYASSLAWALGAPPGGWMMMVAFLLATALSIMGLWILLRDKSDSVIFYVGVILAVPILLATVRRSDVLYVRHFIIGMSFFLLLFSFMLAELCQRGWPGSMTSLVLLGGYLSLNVWHTLGLFEYGRGHYGEAARYFAEHTKGSVVTVGGDQDFRVGTVLQFYFPEAMGNKTGKYCRQGSWPLGGPEWFIAEKESFFAPTPPRSEFTDRFGNSYEFVKTFQTTPLSGLHWFVYHNQAK